MKKPYIFAIDDDLSVLREVERDFKAKFSSHYRVLTADPTQRAICIVRQLTSRGDQVALFPRVPALRAKHSCTCRLGATTLWSDAFRTYRVAFHEIVAQGWNRAAAVMVFTSM